MKPASVERLQRLCRDDRGQVLPITALMLTAMLAMAAFAIDTGHAVYSHRELQALTDADALAAARAIPSASSAAAITGTGGVVSTYSAASGGKNAQPGLPNVSVTSRLECLTTLQAQGIACLGNVPYNAIQVTQTVTLPTFFGGLVGKKSLSMNAVATAATRGGSPHPSNIAIIMDSTLSMNEVDTNCVVNGTTLTQIQCALNGVQVLLQGLNPCGIYQTNCNAVGGVAQNSYDRVALFAFPNVSVATAGTFTTCTQPLPLDNSAAHSFYFAPYGEMNMLGPNWLFDGNNTPWPYLPTGLPYSFPTPGMSYAGLSGAPSAPTYQITNYLSDYRTSDTASSLNPASLLVKAAGGVSGCAGVQSPNWEADWGTYYAGVIYAAQSSLSAAQGSNPGSDNIMIFLGDGDSNALQSGNSVTNSALPTPLNLGAAAPSGNYLTGNSSGTYPSWVADCGQAVVAAKAAGAAGTTVYTVAYGSQSSGCQTDQNVGGTYNNISPCNTMAQMASAPQYFYSDYNQSGSNSSCTASQPYVSLAAIFQSIAANLSGARLIPNNTT